MRRSRPSSPVPRRFLLGLFVALGAALAGAAPAAASPAACTDTWSGPLTGGHWSVAANWSTGNVPASSDTVCIGGGASVILDVSPVTVSGLELDGATLTPAGSASLTVSTELDLQNPTPGSGGTPDVLGSGLALTASGTTTIAPDLDVCLAAGDMLTNSGALSLGDGADLGGGGRSDCSGTSGGSVTNTGSIASQATSTQATIDTLTSDPGSTLAGPGTLKLRSSLSFPSGPNQQIDLGSQLTLLDAASTTLGAGVQVCQGPNTLVTIEPGATVALGQQSNLGDNNDTTGVCDSGTGGGQIVNQGSITASGTSGMVNIAPAFFDNDGAVTVTGSTLAIPASSSGSGVDTGTYTIDTGATLDLSGVQREIDYGGVSGTTFGGGGTLLISGGLTDFQTDANLSGLNHFTVWGGATAEVDATLEGPATGTSPATSIAGDLDGYGTATIAPATSLLLSGTQADLGEGVWVLNEGTVSVGSGSKTCVDGDATLENVAGSTMTLGANAYLGANPSNTECGGGTLLDDASSSLSSASSATINTGLFDNAGAVTISGGTLAIDANNQDTDTGSYSVAGSATLSIQAGATRVLDGTLSGSGKLQLSGTGGSGASLEITPSATASIGSLTVAIGTTLQIDAGPSTPLASSAGTAPLSVSGSATLNGAVAFDGDALTSPASTETLSVLSYGSRSGTPSFPADDNGWSASLGTIDGAPGVVALITPSPPQSQTLPTISGTAATGATLTVTQGTWSGTPTHVTDQWEDCDPFGDPCTPISGATGATYSPTQNDVGDQIQVLETATNAGGSTSAESAMTGAVTTLAPVNLAPPEINGDEGEVGEVLTEVPGEWQNSPSVALQWEDCDITGTTCTPIAGATGASYTTTSHDVNDSIVVVETATNGYGSAQATSDPTEPLLDLGSGGSAGSGDGGGHTSGTATVSVSAHTVAGTALSIALRCPAVAGCPVTLTLTATEPVASSSSHSRSDTHPTRPRSRIVTVGSATTWIGAGDHRTVTVSLNRTGTKLLDSIHRLRAVLTATSHHSTLSTTRVTFTPAPSRPAKSTKPPAKQSAKRSPKKSAKRSSSTSRTSRGSHRAAHH